MGRVLGAIIFLGILSAGAWVAAALYLPYQGFSSSGIYVDIPHGASRRSIARILQEQGVVRSSWVFEGLTRARPGRTLDAGEYLFDHPVTSLEVFDALANGRVYVRELQVPEGYSMFDIADLVQREGFTTREDFLAAARDPSLVRDLAPQAPSLEGFLFPATYEFARHISGRDITVAMVKQFRQKWAGLAADPKNTTAPPVEKTVTLASLVERETPKAEERPEVAAVFANRLRQGIPLQCDPTAVYAMELAGQYDGKLKVSDLQFDSPYNTYRHPGLPPGPIANPGEASLRAALDPQPSDFLYFVANTQGGHFFSKTLAEHDRNVARYRQLLNAQRREVPGDGPGPPTPDSTPPDAGSSQARPRRSP